MYRVGIFDLDGTLVDSVSDLASAINYGLAVMGEPTHPVDAFYQFVGDGVMKLCQRALPDGAGEDQIEKLHGLFQSYYDAHCMDATRPYGGIESVLERLQGAGMLLAVASNKPQMFTEKIVTYFFGAHRFAMILGNDPSRPRKPAPDIIQAILAGLSALPEEAVMIGDSGVDIETAKNAGIDAVGCIWGFRGKEELGRAGATHLAEVPEDLIRIFQGDPGGTL